MIAFALAALLAILTNLPRYYEEASAAGLRKMVDDRWHESEAEALRRVSINRLAVVGSAKSLNAQKARALVAAIAAEAAAVLSLAWAMVAVLY